VVQHAPGSHSKSTGTYPDPGIFHGWTSLVTLKQHLRMQPNILTHITNSNDLNELNLANLNGI